jgi:peptide/nickel transport system substrate-binding protein
MTVRSWLVAGLAAAVLLAAAGCGGASSSSSSGTGGVKKGGILNIGTTAEIDSLNPFVAIESQAYNAFVMEYPQLVQYGPGLKLVGDWATKWETSADGKTWTFHLKPGGKWSDGKPLTAADAAWTGNTILKYKSGGSAVLAAALTHATRFDAPNPTTLVIHYDAPVGNVLAQLEQFWVLPPQVFKQATGNNGKDLKTFKVPVPTTAGGAYQITSYEEKGRTVFKPNPGFYGPKSNAEAVVLQYYTNSTSMIADLRSGTIDFADQVPFDAAQSVKSSGQFHVSVTPGAEVTNVTFNSNPVKPKNRELLNPKVKEALALAIDRQRIVHVVWLDTAKPAASIIPPSTGSWHDASIKPEPFDLDAANAALDSLGYRKGSDGIRVADGHKMSYEVIIPSDLTGVDRTFQIIQADFKKIGVNLTQKSLDSSAAFDAITAPGTKYLNFDLAMWDWVPLIDPDFMLSVVTCAQYGGWSDTGYCDKGYDALYAKQGTTLDQAKRREIVYQMQQKLYEDRPYIFLNYESWISAHSKKWDGFVSSPQGPFNSLSKESLTKVHRVG